MARIAFTTDIILEALHSCRQGLDHPHQPLDERLAFSVRPLAGLVYHHRDAPLWVVPSFWASRLACCGGCAGGFRFWAPFSFGGRYHWYYDFENFFFFFLFRVAMFGRPGCSVRTCWSLCIVRRHVRCPTGPLCCWARGIIAGDIFFGVAGRQRLHCRAQRSFAHSDPSFDDPQSFLQALFQDLVLLETCRLTPHPQMPASSWIFSSPMSSPCSITFGSASMFDTIMYSGGLHASETPLHTTTPLFLRLLASSTQPGGSA